jgi:hypothetical protein
VTAEQQEAERHGGANWSTFALDLKIGAVRSITNCPPDPSATSKLLPPGVSSTSCNRIDLHWEGNPVPLVFRLFRGKKDFSFSPASGTIFKMNRLLDALRVPETARSGLLLTLEVLSTSGDGKVANAKLSAAALAALGALASCLRSANRTDDRQTCM